MAAPAVAARIVPGAFTDGGATSVSRREPGFARPTLTGTTVLASGVAGLVLGWALGYPVLSVIGLGALAAVATSWASLRRAPALAVERELAAHRVERGRPAQGTLIVTNPAARRTRACTALESAGPRVVPIEIPSLDGGEQASVRYQLPTARRGALRVGRLLVVRSDPFGLCQARRFFGDSTTLWVRPHVYAIPPRPGRRDSHIDGPASDAAPHGSTTFHTLREYVLGDDLRKVHWRTSARIGTLMVRQLTDTSLPSTAVVLDLRPSAYDDGDRFEEAVDVAASVVTASLTHGFPVRLVATDGTVRAARAGKGSGGGSLHGSQQKLMDYLAEVRTSLTELKADGIGEIPGGLLKGHGADTLVVVTGDIGSADRAQISTIGRNYGSTVVASLRTPDDHRAGLWPGVTLLEAATAEQLVGRWRREKAT